MIPFSFAHPALLLALFALPLLYFLLRLIPPQPKRIMLPATWLLEGLTPETRTSSTIPPWLLILRLLAAALVIISLAGPTRRDDGAAAKTTSAPLLIVMDNGWASAATWTAQQAQAKILIDRAARDNRPVLIAQTAIPSVTGPHARSRADDARQQIMPQPWPGDSAALVPLLPRGKFETAYLSNGIDTPGTATLANALDGPVTLYQPDTATTALLLRRSQAREKITIAIDGANDRKTDTDISIQAIGHNGRQIARQTVTLPANADSEAQTMDIPLRDIARLSIAPPSGSGAGAIYLFDDRDVKKSVAIVTSEREGASTPLSSAAFYLTRALDGVANTKLAPAEAVLADNPDVIILPDRAALPAATVEKIQEWVESGGILLRFAGPSMARGSKADDPLLPVALRPGGRALDSTLGENETLTIKSFSAEGPLADMTPDPSITVRQQILAEPSPDLEQRIWATLSDNTPLITAARRGAGHLIMVHTTATPAWSDFALSGLYVGFLKRVVSMAGTRSNVDTDDKTARPALLQPLRVMDGMGRLTDPGPDVKPLARDDADTAAITREHPPGLYGNAIMKRAVNLGDRLPPVMPVTFNAENLTIKNYVAEKSQDLRGHALMALMALFLLDWAGTVALRRGLLSIVLVALVFIPAGARASPSDRDFAANVWLAYIPTGNTAVDDETARGLDVLHNNINQRTSIRTAGVHSLDMERDPVILFPMIYWRLTADQPPLSATALSKLQNFLDTGGLLVVDTRDDLSALSASGDNLARQIETLNFPPLVPMASQHVLTKSFYLLNKTMDVFPLHIRVEDDSQPQPAGEQTAGLSGIVWTGDDLAAKWADQGSMMNPERQDVAIRVGINLIMYALTGNYKADQIHIQAILERVGDR